METEKRKKFIVDFFYFAILLAIAIYLCRYAVSVVAAFVIAFLVALLLQPLIRLLNEKCHVQKNIAGVVTVVLFYALIAFLLIISGIKLVAWCRSFIADLPTLYRGTIEPFLYGIFAWLERVVTSIDPSVSAEGFTAYDMMVVRITSMINGKIGEWSGQAVGLLTDLSLKLPKLLLHTLITIIATVFASIDIPLFKRFIKAQFSEKNQQMLHDIQEHLSATLGRYVRSYSLILTITFFELLIGLSIIGIKNVIPIALLIAVFDILPVVGCGTVLIPWSAICVIQGNYPQTLRVIIIYLVILVVRNIIEPKIVGDHVGMHPIVTLMSMVVGTYVFGGIGLLGLPIALALVKSLNDDGIIRVFNELPKDPSAPPKKKKKGLRDLFASIGKPAPKKPKAPAPIEPAPAENQETDGCVE